MAKTKISEYDATAANNTDIDSINIAEGMAPSNVNNAIRELMAHLKDMNIGSTITMLNTTEEDSDGGRVNKIIFKGEQSGGEESVLGEIQVSHDGTADDQKGDLIFKTNDGSDNDAPTEAMRIESDQQVLITTSADAKGLTIKNSGNNRPYLNMDANRSGAGNNLAQMNFKWNGTDVARIIAVAGADTTNKDDAHITFGTASAGSVNEAMRIDSSGNVGIGTDTIDVSTQAGGSGYKALQIESDEGGQLNFDHNDAGTGSTLGQINFQRAAEVVAEIEGVTDGATDNGRIAFRTQPDGGALTERMRINHDGQVVVGSTATTFNADAKIVLSPNSDSVITNNGQCLSLNRTATDGDIVVFYKDQSTVGSIGSVSGLDLFVSGNRGAGIKFTDQELFPVNASGATRDNAIDLGHSTSRFDDIYATNSTIQTSDENEKQNIASLTSAEITAATAINKLFKTFKWKDKVAAKGDNARTHTGVVAQQIQSAMSDAGLDAGNYAFFISSTWWEADEKYTDDDGKEQTRTNIFDTKDEAPEGATEHTRMGIRYAELLSFIGAATEQRLTSIESRLTALEG